MGSGCKGGRETLKLSDYCLVISRSFTCTRYTNISPDDQRPLKQSDLGASCQNIHSRTRLFHHKHLYFATPLHGSHIVRESLLSGEDAFTTSVPSPSRGQAQPDSDAHLQSSDSHPV